MPFADKSNQPDNNGLQRLNKLEEALIGLVFTVFFLVTISPFLLVAGLLIGFFFLMLLIYAAMVIVGAASIFLPPIFLMLGATFIALYIGYAFLSAGAWAIAFCSALVIWFLTWLCLRSNLIATPEKHPVLCSFMLLVILATASSWIYLDYCQYAFQQEQNATLADLKNKIETAQKAIDVLKCTKESAPEAYAHLATAKWDVLIAINVQGHSNCGDDCVHAWILKGIHEAEQALADTRYCAFPHGLGPFVLPPPPL